MIKRILSAIVLIPATLLVVIYATPFFYLLGVGLIGTACLYEYFRLIRAMDIPNRPWFGYVAFWILLILFSLNRIDPPKVFDPIVFHLGKLTLPTVLALTAVAAFLSAVWRTSASVRNRALAFMAETSGILYITLFLYPAVAVRYDFGNSSGLQWTLLLLLVTWGGDSCALVAGKKIGKRPFAPVLSPKKTNEGAIAGLLAGIGIAVFVERFLFTDLPLGHVIAVSALLGIFGQLGDLAESMLKRAAGIKDSSNLIPGHGGVLDRMDSLLFSLPVLYAYLLLLYG
jgi:phosphatidate cytidylyltransferase